MAGGIIPDDWDGSSFKCCQVIMPDSDLYRAFLLGQLAEMTYEAYWDITTGDPSIAARAIYDALEQTVANGLDCEDGGIVLPNTRISLPDPTITQTSGVVVLPANTWTVYGITALQSTNPNNHPGYRVFEFLLSGSFAAQGNIQVRLQDGIGTPLSNVFYIPFTTGALNPYQATVRLRYSVNSIGTISPYLAVYPSLSAFTVNRSGLGQGVNNLRAYVEYLPEAS